MSYDLHCWRPTSEESDSPQAIYNCLCEDGEPEGLAWLPVREIKERFTEAFPTMEDH